jgi:hypothetical protein
MYSGLDHFAIRDHSWPEFRSFVDKLARSLGWRASIPSQYYSLEN